MTKTPQQQVGSNGENRAVDYLLKEGYELLERNYRYKRAEIDLIALWQNELLVFVEVKTRKNDAYGTPETFVSDRQVSMIQSAAESYIHGINWKKDIRFDIIAIHPSEPLKHIKDAFY